MDAAVVDLVAEIAAEFDRAQFDRPVLFIIAADEFRHLAEHRLFRHFLGGEFFRRRHVRHLLLMIERAVFVDVRDQLGISPILMAVANSTGGVMGKIICISSIVVAVAATGWEGGESRILRFVFWTAVTLGFLVGVLVMLQAYVWPFTLTVPAA